MIRIGIIDDDNAASHRLRQILDAIAGYQVIWRSTPSPQTLQKCQIERPDLILLALKDAGGVETTKQIMAHCPCAILLMTVSISRHASIIFEAMGYGALDVVSIPQTENLVDPLVIRSILDKIATIGILAGKARPSLETGSLGRPAVSRSLQGGLPRLVAIGASTGGPKALAALLSQLPPTLPCAIIIIQHVDAQFATGLAQWLNAQSALPVELAVAGSRPTLGKVLLAGSNDHLSLQPDLTLTYTRDPENYPYRPSVDVFCLSLAQYWQRKGIAILLTGMGRDGAKGLGELRGKGWYTIAQDRASCVVYGMPKAAVEQQAVDALLPLEAIAPELIKRLSVNG